MKMIKGKDEEIADLQIQLHDFKKLVVDSGEKVISEINKCSRENNNLVEWLKLYDEQIKIYETENYNLNLRLHFASQQPHHQTQPQSTHTQSQTQHQMQPQSSQQTRPQSEPQSPLFKNLADYFDYYKNQE
jgi:hypothetical protein